MIIFGSFPLKIKTFEKDVLFFQCDETGASVQSKSVIGVVVT